MDDMKPTIVPKSDQLNADDLITGPITIKITGVTIKSGEQPVSIFYEGDNGKPYKCCKSMARIMVAAWGADSKKYVGRSMTLYRDPDVKWAGMAVGGIRISHMSHIADDMTMALTVTRSNRKPFTVRPITEKPPAKEYAPAPETPQPSTPSPSAEPEAGATLSDEQIREILALCEMTGVRVERLLLASKLKTLESMPAANFERAIAWVEKAAKKG